MGNVAITGISGYIGRELARSFECDEDVERVVGIDVVPPPDPPVEKLEYHQRTVEEPFTDLFVDAEIEYAAHLAFILNPIRDIRKMERVNLDGTRNFFEACEKAKTRVVMVVTSATAYGALADNPLPLFEGSPLRATQDFTYAWHKRLQEELCYDFARRNPETALIVARPAVVMGPNMNNWMSRLLEQSSVMAPLGYNPPLQFIHEEDVVRALFRLLKMESTGVYNLGADGALLMSEVALMAGKPVRRIPYPLLRMMAGLFWRLGLKRFGEAPAGWLPFVSHPWVVSNFKIKSEAMFSFRYDSAETLRSFLQSRQDSE